MCSSPALCLCLTSMALVSLPSWHDADFPVQSLVPNWIATSPVQSTAATLLFISLEITVAWSKGELKKWDWSPILRDWCTVHHWLCSEQIPSLEWPLSSGSCMSHWCPGYLCGSGSAAAIQSSSPLCLDLLLPWLSLPPKLSAESLSAHMPSCGCGLGIEHPWFYQIHRVQLGCSRRALQEKRSTSRQCRRRRECAKAVLCYSVVWKPGKNQPG